MGSQGNYSGGEWDARSYSYQEKIWIIKSTKRCTNCWLSSHDRTDCSADWNSGRTWCRGRCITLYDITNPISFFNHIYIIYYFYNLTFIIQFNLIIITNHNAKVFCNCLYILVYYKALAKIKFVLSLMTSRDLLSLVYVSYIYLAVFRWRRRFYHNANHVAVDDRINI